MSRTTAVPARELAICQRLKDFRLSTKLSRAAFARELGITRSRLNNYERGATPVPYAIGTKLCATFNLSQEWLSEGDGDVAGFILISPQIESKIAPQMLFSNAYDDYLKRELASQLSDFGSSAFARALGKMEPGEIEVRLIRSVGATSGAATRAALAGFFKKIMDTLPAHLVWPYYRHLVAASQRFEAEHGAVGEKNMLTDASSAVSMSHVKSQLKTLLADVNRLTKEPGKKTKLAEFLGAPLASVSRWLSGDREPGGETALRMHYWVNHPELH